MFMRWCRYTYTFINIRVLLWNRGQTIVSPDDKWLMPPRHLQHQWRHKCFAGLCWIGSEMGDGLGYGPLLFSITRWNKTQALFHTVRPWYYFGHSSNSSNVNSDCDYIYHGYNYQSNQKPGRFTSISIKYDFL